MGFSRQEYWTGLPFPSPGDFPDPGIEPGSPAFPADALTSEPPGTPKSRGNWGWKEFIICQGPNTGFPGGASGKEFPCQCRRHKRCRFDPWIGKIPWRRACNPLQCYCLENSTGRGARRAPWGHNELDMTERLNTNRARRGHGARPSLDLTLFHLGALLGVAQ